MTNINGNTRPYEMLLNKFLGDIDNIYSERDFYKQRVEELEKQISENLKRDIESHSEMANSMMDLVLNHTVIKNDEVDYKELFDAIFEDVIITYFDSANEDIYELKIKEHYGILSDFIKRCKELNLKFKITKQGDKNENL